MLLGQVLEADADEPPNFRTLLLLLVISASINNVAGAVTKRVDVVQDEESGNLVHLETGDGVVEAATAGTEEIFTQNERHSIQSMQGIFTHFWVCSSILMHFPCCFLSISCVKVFSFTFKSFIFISQNCS